MTEFFTKIALKHRKIVYIATGILTLLMFGAVSKLKMNPDWKELLPRDNEIVSNYKKGSILDEIGFRELTETYRKVRYGDKEVYLKGNVVDMAKLYEKAISRIVVEKDGRRTR